MVGKNNQYVKKIKQGTKVETYSIKKFKVGIASVAIGCSVFFGAGAVAMAGEQTGAPVPPGENNTTVVPQGEERAITGDQSATGAQSNPTPAKEGKIEPEKPKDTVNKAKLETLIKEVEGLNLEKYTEESVKGLKTELAKAKEVFETAQNKEEVEAAWRTLFTYKNSKLVVKKTPKLPQDNTPKPNTTNGKETAGRNAENTEPNGTNIAGHNHSMNGTTRSEGSGFRATPEESSGIEFGISNGQRDGNYSRTDRYFDTISSNSYSRIFKFVSKTGDITGGITATSSAGRSVTLEEMTKFPNNGTTRFVKAKTDFTGVSDAILSFTVKTAGGDKTAQIGVYRSLGKPTIKVPSGQTFATVDEYLKGKAGTRPTINVEVPVVPNLPAYAKMKVYLVKDNDRDKGYYDGDEYAENHNPRPTRLTAKVDVSTGVVDPGTKKTTVTIQSKDYLKDLENDKYFALAVIEINDEKINTNPGIRASSFSEAATVAANIDKAGAIAEIDAAKAAKDAAIESNANITNKAAAKALIKAAADAAKTEINKDTTNTADKVTTAKDAGLLAISKAEAIAEIDAAKAAKEKAIDDNTDIAQADKATAKAPIATAADAAKTEINKDTTNTAALVTTEKEKGILALYKVEARIEIDAALAAKNKKVDINNDLTTEEKAEVKKQTQKEATDAIANTNEATTSTTVTTAKDNGIKAINAVALPTKTVKSEAISEINKALAAKNKTVDANNNLTTEEKSEVKKQTQKEATDAIANINKATTSADVTTAKDNGIKAINAVAIPTKTVKSNAIEEVKKALDTKVKSIESSKEFTDNDKGILKDKAEKAAMTAIVKIKTATTNAAVETAKTEGIERINSVEARLAVKLEIPELIITKWQDEAGNDLRPADAKAPSELGEANEALAHGEIPGYEYVVTKTDKENVVVTHIFRKLPKKDRTFPEKPKTSNPNKADESQSPAKENVNMKSNLPNTGVTGTNSGLAGLGLAVFGGLLTVARQRRRNK